MRKGVVLAGVVIALVAAFATAAGVRAHRAVASGTGCQLKSAKGNIKHVIYIQFDNTHFRRDNPNVPSDLEQMPHLLNFINGNGRLPGNGAIAEPPLVDGPLDRMDGPFAVA